MAAITSDFSAREPSLGYFYQIKYSLLLLITNARELESPKLRLENLDDIEIESINSLQLFQTKLHINSKANLTDASVDFWKTIRIWTEHIKAGVIDIGNTVFVLVTTAAVSPSSYLANFKKVWLSEKEIETIIKQMDVTAISTNNQVNSKAFQAYMSLDTFQKRLLVSRIQLFDSSISIADIDEKIRKQIALFVYPSHRDAFIEILEGWWFKKAIQNLLGENDAIESDELQRKITDTLEGFSADNLPNHFPEQLEISDSDIDVFKQKHFLKQLELIEIQIDSQTAKRAISDFRRAFDQRSKWLRLQLLNPDEEEEYDKRLYDHWLNIFDILRDECNGQNDEVLRRMGRDFYIQQFAKACPKIKIREKFNEDFLTRGSYQMLSDKKRIGWHPKFNENI